MNLGWGGSIQELGRQASWVGHRPTPDTRWGCLWVRWCQAQEGKYQGGPGKQIPQDICRSVLSQLVRAQATAWLRQAGLEPCFRSLGGLHSVQFSCSVMSDSSLPHESKHARPPCPSPTPITSWEIDGETVETVADFIFWGSKITADGDCSRN